MKKILLLIKNQSTISSLYKFLKTKGYLVKCANNISRAETLLKQATFNLCVCERQLTDGDVLEFLDLIKEQSFFMRSLVLSKEKSQFERIKILQLADDFLTEPFSFLELTLKIEKMLSLEKIAGQNLIENSSFLLKDGGLNDNSPGHFRPQELKILECFIKHKNLVISYEIITAYVWGYREPTPLKKTISVYIRRIRTKLPNCFKILTIKNRGYKLIDLKEISS